MSGEAPTEESLRPCGRKPNCVCSEDPRPRHHIAPITCSGDPAVAFAALETLILAQPRTELVTRRAHYLHITVTSRLLGFVDDLEAHLDPEAGLIHLRSASRQGYSDFGVNRARVEGLRRAFVE